MKKRLNRYSIYRSNQSYLSGLTSYEDAINAIRILVEGLGWDFDKLQAEIAGNETNPIKQVVKQRSFWFKPNRLQIELRLTRGELVEIDSKTDEIDNKILYSQRTFDGSALKYNAIEEPTKWNPNGYLHPSVWLAVSAERNKGISALPKFKERNNKAKGYDAVKIAGLLDRGVITHHIGVDTHIRKLNQSGKSIPEIFNTLKGKHNVSNNKLRYLIRSIVNQ